MRRALLIPLALLAALLWPVVTSRTKTTAQETPPPAVEAGATDADGAEVLTRGPIHEAFAEPVTEPEPTLIVPKKPPEDVEEVPPEYAPEEGTAIWIKGYWAWDDEREDYIWISGVHRVVPPNQRWVAGYWAEADGGWQWNRGFWAPTETAELSYREPPPESLEEGASSPSPGDDYFYVPGNWGYYETGYRWSPGYWAMHRPNWCWVQARWVWTPRGCIFLNGYWDYAFARRGFCYAPVYFSRPIYANPGYYYRPWCGLNVGNLFVHFWVRPTYCHYYFGNYYANYDRWGIRPWHSYYGHGRHYDPILSWCNVHYHGRGINYTERIAGWHRYYDRHVDDRPPITFADQRRLATRTNITNITEINKITNVSVKQNFLAGRVDDLARMENTPVRLRRLNETQQREVTQRARQVSQEISEVRKQRRDIERVALADRPEGRGPDVGEKGAKGAKVANGEKGIDVGGKGRVGADAGAKGRAEGRGEARANLKLPESRVAIEQPKVEVPERPDRARGEGQARRGGPEGRGEKGAKGPPDRSARTPDGQKGEKGDRPDRPGADRGPRVDRPGTDTPAADRPGTKAPGADRPGTKAPGADRPGTDRPGADRPPPGPRVERPEGGRPDAVPRPGADGDRPGSNRPKGGSPKGAEPPQLNTPRPEPRVERPEPRVERPTPRVERPEPRVERPAPRVERPAPKIERPAPRVERPASQPRIERPAPQAERAASQPRVEQPAPRVERSAPQPRVERSSASSSRSSRPARSSSGSSRSRGRDRD